MQLLKYVPGNETLTIEANKELNFTWESGNSSYPLVKAKDYPVIREIVAKAQGTMDGNMLVKALASAVGYCAADETRPVLSGVTIFPGENSRHRRRRRLQDGIPDDIGFIPHRAASDHPFWGRIAPQDSLWQHTRPDVTLGDSLVGLVTQKRQIDLTFAEGEKGSPGQAPGVLRQRDDSIRTSSKAPRRTSNSLSPRKPPPRSSSSLLSSIGQ